MVVSYTKFVLSSPDETFTKRFTLKSTPNLPIWGMTLLLAMITAIQPLSTDMYLPSLLSIGDYFNTDMSKVQFTLTAFMIGFATGQIFYGPFADKYGRRPVLLISLAIYIAGTLTCLFAQNIETLIFGRFMQAVGGCGPVVLGRAIVRDILKGAEAGKMLASMGFIMGFVPLIAPIIGGLIETYFGWRGHFYIFFIAGCWIACLIIFLLPETVNQKTTAKLTPRTFVKIYDGLLSSKIFRFFAMRNAFAYGGLFAFITGSSYYIQTRFELTPKLFGFAFAFVVLGYLTGTLLSARYGGRLGSYKMIFVGACFQLVGGLGMIGLHVIGAFHVVQIVVPMYLYLLGNGIIMPQSQAGSMHDFPHKAGAASSLAGVMQVGAGAIVGTIVGSLIESYIIILPLMVVLVAMMNFIACVTHRNHSLSDD